jgi:hypothetical protein
MRDYYPLISSMVAGLDNNTGESRRALYGRARSSLYEQLRRIEPPLTNSEMTSERLSLEAAIRKFEAEAIRRPRNPPPPDLISAAAVESVGARPPEMLPGAIVQAEPARTRLGARYVAQSAGPREQLVELALLAQVVEARERHVNRAPRPPRKAQRDIFQTGPRQRDEAAVQPVSASPQMQQRTTALDVLTKLVEAGQGERRASNSNRTAQLSSRSLSDAPGRADFITPLLWLLYLMLGFAQLVAFFHGLQTGFGLGGVASIGIFMLLYLTGSLGSIPMAIVSFYGAWRGWQWPIWGAALLAFPFVVFSFAFLGIGGFYNFFNKQKTSPLVQIIRSRLESPRWRERARQWRAGWGRFLRNDPGAPGGGLHRPRGRR